MQGIVDTPYRRRHRRVGLDRAVRGTRREPRFRARRRRICRSAMQACELAPDWLGAVARSPLDHEVADRPVPRSGRTDMAARTKRQYPRELAAGRDARGPDCLTWNTGGRTEPMAGPNGRWRSVWFAAAPRAIRSCDVKRLRREKDCGHSDWPGRDFAAEPMPADRLFHVEREGGPSRWHGRTVRWRSASLLPAHEELAPLTRSDRVVRRICECRSDWPAIREFAWNLMPADRLFHVEHGRRDPADGRRQTRCSREAISKLKELRMSARSPGCIASWPLDRMPADGCSRGHER